MRNDLEIALSGILATISFLLTHYTNLFPALIGFRIVAAISLIPMSLGVIELIKNPNDKETAIKFCIYNLVGIFVSVILINLYFLKFLR